MTGLQKFKIFALVTNVVILATFFQMMVEIDVEYSFPLEFLSALNIKENGELSALNQTNSQKSRLLNLTEFKYILNNRTKCPAREPPWKILLVIIHSSRRNFRYRDFIRRTWASKDTIKNWRIRYIFSLGEHNNTGNHFAVQTVLEFENERHGDILMGNFVDSYVNMTYKHMMGYKWTTEFCPQADFILKVDDDTFVNTFELIDILEDIKFKNYDLICDILAKKRPIRDTSDKWYVSYEEYSAPVYPPYCMGAAYIISEKWLKRFYSSVYKLKYFWIDDVYVTGILREYVQVYYKEKMNIIDVYRHTKVMTGKVMVDIGTYTKKLMSAHNHNGLDPDKDGSWLFGAIARGPNSKEYMQILWDKAIRLQIFAENHIDKD